jgi:hypothetical protein
LGKASPHELTHHFHQHLAYQIPQGFKISHLPSKILSWITVLLVQTHKSYLMLNKRAQMRLTTAVGDVGLVSVKKWDYVLTPSSLLSPNRTPSSLHNPSSQVIAMPTGAPTVDLKGIVNDQWHQALSERAQAKWLQHFGGDTNQAPFTMRTERPCDRKSPPC